MSDRYLCIYAHNQLVTGTQRAALYDLQAGRVRIIPRALVPLLDQLRQQPVAAVRDAYFADSAEVLQQYLDLVIREDWGFYTPTPERFPKLDLNWTNPFARTSAIVAHDGEKSSYALDTPLREIDAIGCQYVELWLTGYPAEPAAWLSLAGVLQQLEFRRLVLLTDLGDRLEPPLVDTLREAFPRLARIYSLGAKTKATTETDRSDLYYSDQPTVAALAASWDREQQYIISSRYFREALVANPYFNRRVAIDRNGGIRNDLLHASTVFGRVGSEAIASVLEQPAFQALWRARPDAIRETKDSELRYCLPYNRPLTWDEAREEWYWSATP